MKKFLSVLAFAACCTCGFAQDPVLTFNGNLNFIPGSMTKSGEAYMVLRNYDYSFTIYDGDFNVVKTFTDSGAGLPYQQRVVTLTRIFDPGTSETGGHVTRAADDEWTIVDDRTDDYTTSPTISSIKLRTDNNYQSNELYISQTLFDNDEEFEYIRRKVTIIPITVKYADYVKEHSTDNLETQSQSYGNATIDSLMNATGADSYEWFWDNEADRQLIRLYKHETYGGIFTEGIEIVNLDGKVKSFLPNISSVSTAYFYRGKCYVAGYNKADNSDVLYLLGDGATRIRELSRTKAGLSVKRVGSNLVIDCDTDEQQTIVLSTMDGRIVRSLTTRQGSNTISLNGLIGGIYNVTLYQQSSPVGSSKIIIK